MAALNSNTVHKINNSYESEPSTGSGVSEIAIKSESIIYLKLFFSFTVFAQ